MDYNNFYSFVENISSYNVITEAERKTHIIIDNLYPKIEEVLSTPLGDKKFKQLVGSYMDRNSAKLHTSGPVHMIPFGDTDKAYYFTLFKNSQYYTIPIIITFRFLL